MLEVLLAAIILGAGLAGILVSMSQSQRLMKTVPDLETAQEVMDLGEMAYPLDAVMDEEASVVWETNGAVEPHRIWIYPDGKKPEDGLMLNIDSFGAVKVLDGDGREED